MAVQRWTFYDGTTTVTLEVNPASGGTPDYEKNISEHGTTAADGVPILFEGSRPPKHLEFSGKVLTQTHFEMLRDWWAKSTPVRIVDDLNRTFWVYFRSFKPNRVRSALHPWKHEYSMEAIVLTGG